MYHKSEFLIVPRGVENRPVAEEEVHVLLFESASTINTGNVTNERTVAHLDDFLICCRAPLKIIG
jgi:hypothetical protein